MVKCGFYFNVSDNSNIKFLILLNSNKINLNSVCIGYSKFKFNLIKILLSLIIKLKKINIIKYKYIIKYFINSVLILYNNKSLNISIIYCTIINFLFKFFINQIKFINV